MTPLKKKTNHKNPHTPGAVNKISAQRRHFGACGTPGSEPRRTIIWMNNMIQPLRTRCLYSPVNSLSSTSCKCSSSAVRKLFIRGLVYG